MLYAIITLILSVILVDFSFFIYEKIKILYDRFVSHKFFDDDFFYLLFISFFGFFLQFILLCIFLI